MAYIITNTSGTRNFQIADQQINRETSINLIGRNFPNYGEPIAENFVQMLENFAHTIPPARAVEGQLWYDTDIKQLRVLTNGFWSLTSSVRVTQSDVPSNVQGSNRAGSLYFDSDAGTLYVARGTNQFVPALIAGEIINPNSYFGNVISTPPSAVSSYGTVLKNLFITDTTGVQRAVLALESVQGAAETIMAIFSDHAEFEANVEVDIFSQGEPKPAQQLADSGGIGAIIRKGLNLRGDNQTRVEVSNVSDHANLAFALNTGSYENGAANLALTITADNVAHQDADFVPNTADTHSLGNASNMFSDAYATTVWLGNGVGGGIVKNGNSTVVIGDPVAPIDEAYIDLITSNSIAATSASISTITGDLAGDVVGELTGNVTGQVSDISNHTTTDLAEGDNLYYTTERVRTNVSVDAQSNLTYNNVTGVFGHQLTTTDIVEGDNLYYTTARVRGNISAATVGNDLGEFGNLSYNSSTGAYTFTAPSVQTVRDHIGGSGSIDYGNADGIISVIPAGVDHNQLNNYVSDQHIDHSQVNVIAGAGLTGGGAITGNVTVNTGQGFGITVNPTNIAVNTGQIRGLFSIAAGSNTVLSYSSTLGQIGFLGDTSTVTSAPTRWVFSGNIDQTVSGQKTFSRSTTFSFSNGPNILLENEPTIRYSGGANPTALRFESSVDPGNIAITFTQNGGIVATDDITAFSDRRLKTDLEVITGALDKVGQLTGYTFGRIDMPSRRQTGLIAQEVEAVLPEAVGEHGSLLTVSYGNLMGLIVEATKELRGQVADLQQQIDGLQQQIVDLQSSQGD